MKSKILHCTCSRPVLVQLTKGEEDPVINGCPSCKPINYDGSPNLKAT